MKLCALCPRVSSLLLALSCAVMLVLAACGGRASTSPDGASGGMCGGDTPQGQACNALVNVGALITPTCTTGVMPTGVGGAIVDGTYVLTSQTYYNVPACPTIALSGTALIAGRCRQGISGGPFNLASTATVMVEGNTITSTIKCPIVDLDAGSITRDAPTKTFTATPTTFTIFTGNAAAGNPNPDRVEVFAKQ